MRHDGMKASKIIPFYIVYFCEMLYCIIYFHFVDPYRITKSMWIQE